MNELDVEFIMRFTKLDQAEREMILQLMREIAEGEESAAEEIQ